MTFDEFKTRIRAEGFAPSDESLKEMYAALPFLEAMRQRVRRDADHADEPAYRFTAE